MVELLDITDIEILPDGTEQPAPIVIKDKATAMKFGRLVADSVRLLDQGAITQAEAEYLWTKGLRQARQEDTESRHERLGIVTARRMV